MTTRLLPHMGLGKELSDLLREKLAIPAHCTRFSVHFGANEVVTVDCTYMPSEPEQETDQSTKESRTFSRAEPLSADAIGRQIEAGARRP